VLFYNPPSISFPSYWPVTVGVCACSADAGGSTALHRAAVDDNVACLGALLAAGVPVDVVDSRHRTALDLARIHARRHCARYVVYRNIDSRHLSSFGGGIPPPPKKKKLTIPPQKTAAKLCSTSFSTGSINCQYITIELSFSAK